MQKKAVIIGAGPAGLTAAYELLTRTDIIPIILEKSGEIGGISRTINYKGNRMDVCPHRFFSKSDRVIEWWLKMMPLEPGTDPDTTIRYQNRSPSLTFDSPAPKDPDKTMLVIQLLTRIYTGTCLIEQFLYPKYGLGSLWEEVARQVQALGGKIYFHHNVQKINAEKNSIKTVFTADSETGQAAAWEGDYFFSTMPVQELIAGLEPSVPDNIQQVAAGLQYRDSIYVGVLLKQLSIPTQNGQFEKIELKDNWIYIQERDVKAGRLMIYNNWGSGMIKDPSTTWIGMEYFCNKTDDFWAASDEEIQRSAIAELDQMGLARRDDVLDSIVSRMDKTYPANSGTYKEFYRIREYTDNFANLFLIGRNGMHKYNNADHSMLTAMVAIDTITEGVTSKANIWNIATVQEYHEERSVSSESPANTPSNLRRAQRQSPFLLDYLWKNRSNRAWWIFGVIAFLIQLMIFKLHYPYANYMPDSYSYLEAASSNADVNTWPVAYSKFLRFVSAFTHSDKIVVGFQYLLIQCSTLLFLFSILYWLKPARGFRIFLLLFFVLNPLPLYVANYISADALFTGLSMLWMTTLVWMIFRPRSWMLPTHALLLLACFTLRYNAIYYPFVALLAFLLSKQPGKLKFIGFALSIVLVASSFLYTSQKMKEVTGHWQFSAFGGWQMANNALYMYEHVPAGQRGSVPPRFAQLEAMVRQHMDTLKKVKFTHEDTVNSFFYLWNSRGPLIQYLHREYKNKRDSTIPYFNRWASEGPLYSQYAFYLIRKFPLQFGKNFLWPNAIRYATPPVEFLGTYNMGSDSVQELAKVWFNYKSRKVQEHVGNRKQGIAGTEWFLIFSPIANILLVTGIIGVFIVGAIRWKEYGLIQLLAMILTFWLSNALFSIFASPIVLRYQIFPMFVIFAVGTILVERIYQMAKQE